MPNAVHCNSLQETLCPRPVGLFRRHPFKTVNKVPSKLWRIMPSSEPPQSFSDNSPTLFSSSDSSPLGTLFLSRIHLLFSSWHVISGFCSVPCTATNPKIKLLSVFFSCPCKIPLQITFIPCRLIKIIFLAKLAFAKNTRFCYEVQSVPHLSLSLKKGGQCISLCA